MEKAYMELQANRPSGSGRYKQLKISVDPVIASAFKDACAAADVSMAAQLSQYMAGFPNTAANRKPLPDYSTRKRRREAIRDIVKQLAQIRDCEERYRDRIPENLQSSMIYDKADELVSVLEEAIDLMASV